MRIFLTFLFILISLIDSITLSAETVNNLQTLETVILVSDRFETADDLEIWVGNNGGYLISRSRDQVILRVPGEILGHFIDFLETIAEEIVKIEQQSEDISTDLLEMEAGIRSKEELFNQAVELFDQSDFSTTFEIESEIHAILNDIEKLKGRYRKLLGEGSLARIRIDFRLQEEKVPDNLPSAFHWINTVDFYQLMEQFNRY
jgi:Domain of unknown function (DUF4349)